MKLIEFAVKRSIAIAMLFLGIVLFGAVSFPNLKMDLFPQITMPYAMVITNYSGAGPAEVEGLVTKPLESALTTVSNVKGHQSVSSQGTSTIYLEFESDTDMDYATLNMREKIDMVKAYLPEDADDSIVMQMDMEAMPSVILAAYGGRDLQELKEVIEETVLPRLERIDGVGKAELGGGYDRVIEIVANPSALSAYGLTNSSIVQAIAMDNLNYSGGTAEDAGKERAIRVMGEYNSLSDLANLPLNTAGGGVVRLADVATINDVLEKQDIICRINGVDGVSISITKESGANIVNVSQAVAKEIKNLEKDLPQGFEIKNVYDGAKYILLLVESLLNNLFVGALLALLVLYFFLRDIRLTLIVGLAIPISLISAGVLLFLNNMTLNVMTLGGLALGVGMLVDNSIVILESIARHRTEADGHIADGKLLAQVTAISGGTESAMAITASTITTVVIFLPIVFSDGLASMFFTDFAWVVTFTLVASLFVSLTLVPMISSKISEFATPVSRWTIIEKGKDKFASAYQWFLNKYNKILNWALSHRKKTVIGTALALVLSFAAIPLIGAELLPASDEGMLTLSVELPDGYSVQQTSDACFEIEDIVAKQSEDLDTVLSFIGNGSSNMATILIVAKPLDDRKRDIWQIADSMRDELEAIPGVDVVISAAAVSSMMGGMADISYVIKGDNLDELQKIGDDLQSIMESVPDTYEVTSSAESSKQELQLLVNRQKAQQYGLGVYQISQAVRAAFEGTVASKFREGGQEYDIKVKMPENLSKTTADLQSITVTGPTGVSVPLSAVAEIKVADGAVSVSRENGSRMITVSCQVLGSDLKGVAEQIQTKMDTELFLPDGYLIEQGGSLEEMLDVFSDLTLALLLAILLIYMVLAALYESFIDPFVVMFTLPPAIIGVLLFLAIFNKTLNISSFIGIIMLAGIVVNNGIVLVDYIKQQRKTGLTVREAVEKAGMVRVRPVLMTALTTILAMFPLCFSRGEGAEMTSPMAVAVVGGLIFATAFTLVFVPVIYTLINEIPDRRRDKKAKKRAKKAAEKEQKALNAANAAPIIEEEL